MYQKGFDVQQNMNIANSLFEKASNQNVNEAQYILATQYLSDVNNPSNMAKALYLLNKFSLVRVAAAGHYCAANQLGIMYATGLGVKKDSNDDINFFKIAAIKYLSVPADQFKLTYTISAKSPSVIDILNTAKVFSVYKYNKFSNISQNQSNDLPDVINNSALISNNLQNICGNIK